MAKHVKMVSYNPIDNPVTRCIDVVKQLELIQMNTRRKRNREKKVATFGCGWKVILLREDELERDVIYIHIVICDVEKDVEDKTKCYINFDARYSDPNQDYDDKKDSWYVYFDTRKRSRPKSQPHNYIYWASIQLPTTMAQRLLL